MVPPNVHSLCEADSLCVVAFLPQSGYQENQIADLSRLMGDFKDQQVQMFWVEAGNYADCEHVLHLRTQEPQVIAFRAHEPRFAQMPQQFTLDGMRQFVNQVKSTGLSQGYELPLGGIQLLGH